MLLPTPKFSSIKSNEARPQLGRISATKKVGRRIVILRLDQIWKIKPTLKVPLGTLTVLLLFALH
jgi:hypothetical protein